MKKILKTVTCGVLMMHLASINGICADDMNKNRMPGTVETGMPKSPFPQVPENIQQPNPYGDPAREPQAGQAIAPEPSPAQLPSSAGVPQAAAPAAERTADFQEGSKNKATYKLRPGDKVNIKIYPTDEYIKNTETEITPEGNVTLALVGKIPIAGKTPVEASQVIAKLLDQDYLVNPEVVVEISQYTEQNIVVLGEVKRPGTYKIPQGAVHITLIQAVSLAGGFSDIANIKKIKVVRRGQAIHANAEAIMSGKETDIQLQPDDVVNVPESLF